MNNSFLEKQINVAKDNFNYFFMKMITKIIKLFIVFTCILLINQFFDTLFMNIITLLFTLIFIFRVYKIIDEYTYILNDIKNTFIDIEFPFIVDTNVIKNDLIGMVVKYEK